MTRGWLAAGALVLAGLTRAAAAAAPARTSPARAELEAAAAIVEREPPAEAERLLRAMLAKGGGTSVRGLLAVALARQDQDKAAVEELVRGLAAGPDAPDRLTAAAARVRSVRTLLLLARLEAERGNAPGAQATLAKTRELAPSAEEVLSAQAQLWLALRKPVLALTALETLTRLDPGAAEHRYLAGVALLQAGDAQRASEELQEAERLEPGRPRTLVALGLALNQRKLYEEALPYLARALEREAGNADVLAALAEAEEGLGRLADAEGHATQALSHAGGHALAHLVLGMVRMKQERYAEARDALAQAAAADPSSAKAHYQLRLAYSRLGDEAGARREQAAYEEARRAAEKPAGGGMGQ
jgi:tetratricopeptide (TPR) repeat protein